MINELLNEINKAEKAAAELQENALAEAKTMLVNAEKDAQDIKAQARADAKEERNKVIAIAEAEAEENFAKVLDIGKKEAEKLKQTTDISAASNSVASAFLKKWDLQ